MQAPAATPPAPAAPNLDIPSVDNVTQPSQSTSPELFTNTPAPYQPPAPTSPPIAEQWQTKQEYTTNQVAVAAPRTDSGITHKAAVALGISVLLFILAVTTPIGDIGAFNEGSGRAITARPIAGIAVLGVVLSYFVMVISGIATSKSTGKVLSIIGLVVGAIMIANPVGILLLFMLIGCNFTACQGT